MWLEGEAGQAWGPQRSRPTAWVLQATWLFLWRGVLLRGQATQDSIYISQDGQGHRIEDEDLLGVPQTLPRSSQKTAEELGLLSEAAAVAEALPSLQPSKTFTG